jgi:SAM-dependent methyltransferase
MGAIDLDVYRASAAEQERIADLMRLLPAHGGSVLDVGARDGYITKLLAQRFANVIALDLARPAVSDPKVTCVEGDVTHLEFGDDSVEYVVCAEVLEHIPGGKLQRACAELARVAQKAILIGVPFRQDLRFGRTVCGKCGAINPPWGHVNAFDERKIVALFAGWRVREWSYVGKTRERTNFVSALLMDLAGNPFGTYDQEERCVHCGAQLIGPPRRSFPQKVATRIAWALSSVQQRFAPERPKWMHALLTPA